MSMSGPSGHTITREGAFGSIPLAPQASLNYVAPDSHAFPTLNSSCSPSVWKVLHGCRGKRRLTPAESGRWRGMTMSGTHTVTKDEASERERRLDEALDATFPASDPVAMSYASAATPPEVPTAEAMNARKSAA